MEKKDTTECSRKGETTLDFLPTFTGSLFMQPDVKYRLHMPVSLITKGVLKRGDRFVCYIYSSGGFCCAVFIPEVLARTEDGKCKKIPGCTVDTSVAVDSIGNIQISGAVRKIIGLADSGKRQKVLFKGCEEKYFVIACSSNKAQSPLILKGIEEIDNILCPILKPKDKKDAVDASSGKANPALKITIEITGASPKIERIASRIQSLTKEILRPDKKSKLPFKPRRFP